MADDSLQKKRFQVLSGANGNLYPIRRMVHPHHARTNFPATNAKTAASKTKPVMMQHMATGVPPENTARRAEEIMPLPYWSAPMSAAAEPVISSGTLESAAALEHAVIIPFVLHTKNMGMAIPHRPSIPVSPSASSQREKSAAMLVAALSSREREKCVTNMRLK